MNNSTQIYSLNFNKMTLQDGDFIKYDDWFDKIYEDGGFTNDYQYMIFNSNGVEIVVDFQLIVSGSIIRDNGDYYTPPSVDVDIDEYTVNITGLHVDEWEVSLNRDLEKLLEVEIKKHL